MSDERLGRLVRLTRATVLALGVLHALPKSADAIKLNGPLVSGGRVLTSAISPDGSRVVCEADQDTKNVIELYEESGRICKRPPDTSSGRNVRP
jgi:hypothetical protein